MFFGNSRIKFVNNTKKTEYNQDSSVFNEFKNYNP